LFLRIITMSKSLQEQYSPQGICFGCGPANAQGLHVQSFPNGDEVIAHWKPKPEHQAFPGMVNGGIIGAILDCHCNWTAAWHLMQKTNTDTPPCTVTANYTIKLLRPTPIEEELELRARVITSDSDRATIAGELVAKGKLCATCEGTFVAVKPGHPAYHRW
jgi:acyl-coenzyme A thioesterase PaaI-like protein